MNTKVLFFVWMCILIASPLFSQESTTPELDAPIVEKRQQWRLDFSFSMNARLPVSHPALKENWEAFTPEDAIPYKEDWHSTPYSLELNYSPSKHFSIGPYVKREIYKMRDKKENEWDQAQAPTGSYIPSGYYDVIFESKYIMKFVPLSYGLQAKLIFPTSKYTNSFVSLQGRVGRFTLFNSKYKYNRINEYEEIFKPVKVLFTFMSPFRTTQINFSGSGNLYALTLGYFRQLKGAPNSFLGLELNWQHSVLTEIKTSVQTHDETYPGISVIHPGSPLEYPSFTEGEEGILWNEAEQKPAALDFGGFSLSATLRFPLQKGK